MSTIGYPQPTAPTRIPVDMTARRTPATGATDSADPANSNADPANSKELREAFNAFVGEVFYGQMLKAMHKTAGKPAYFHGGQAEEIFQQQLDQVLVDKMTETGADALGRPLFEASRLKKTREIPAGQPSLEAPQGTLSLEVSQGTLLQMIRR